MSHMPRGRNMMDNANFNIWQRGATFTSPADAARFCDRWIYTKGTAGTVTITQDTGVPNTSSLYSMKIACTGTDTSIASNDQSMIFQVLEGYTWNALYGKPMVMSFWVKSYQTGTFCMSIRTGDASFVTEYVVNASATWEKKVIVIPPATIGTWGTGTAASAYITFCLMSGTDGQTTLTNTWKAENKWATSNQTNLYSSTNNYIQFSQVQLEAGSSATEFEALHPADDLARCQRYYYQTGGTTAYEMHATGWCATTSIGSVIAPIPQMRAIPTVAYTTVGDFGVAYGSNAISACTALARANSGSNRTCAINITTTATPLTAGWACMLQSNNNTSDRLTFSAEL